MDFGFALKAWRDAGSDAETALSQLVPGHSKRSICRTTTSRPAVQLELRGLCHSKSSLSINLFSPRVVGQIKF